MEIDSFKAFYKIIQSNFMMRFIPNKKKTYKFFVSISQLLLISANFLINLILRGQGDGDPAGI